MRCRGGQDTTVKLYDALKGELLFVLKGLEGGTGTISFEPSLGNLIAAGGWDGKVIIWDTRVCPLSQTLLKYTNLHRLGNR
jgi:WD40 repeat protein